MTMIIDSKYNLLEDVFFREEPRFKVRRATSKHDGKQYIIKIWDIYRYGINGNNYKERFQLENTILREENQELKPYLPKLIDFGLEGRVSPTSDQVVCYQIFQDIKYDNILAYHQSRSMIPQPIGLHLFRKIIKAVKILNSQGKTFFCLNPTYIMIDKNLNPIFMDLSNVRKLNHAEIIEQGDDYKVTKSFQPPEMLKKKGTYSLLKMDSFQLGVLATHLLISGTPPFEHIQTDIRFKMVESEQFDKFFEMISPKKAVNQNLKDLVSVLIAVSPESRIDPKDIQNTKWWKQESVATSPAELDAYINSIIEKKQKLQLLLKSKVPAPEQQKSTISAFHKSGLFRCAKESYSHLTAVKHSGKITPNIFYWAQALWDTFQLLKNKSTLKFNSVQESKTMFTLIVGSMDTNIRIQVSVLCHPQIQYMSIVNYKLLNSDLFYYDQIFQKAIEYFEAENKCQ